MDWADAAPVSALLDWGIARYWRGQKYRFFSCYLKALYSQFSQIQSCFKPGTLHFVLGRFSAVGCESSRKLVADAWIKTNVIGYFPSPWAVAEFMAGHGWGVQAWVVGGQWNVEEMQAFLSSDWFKRGILGPT